jgi:hypothetical protein
MTKIALLAVLAMLVFAPVPASAQESTLQFKPPDTTSPNRRVGGFVRGVGDALPSVINLAPSRTRLTVAAQPVLYWYLSGPADHPFEISLIGRDSVEPLMEFRIEPPVEAGVYAIRLADYGIELEPGRTYEWFVALISDDEVRSKDVVSGAAIKRIDKSPELAARLAAAAEQDRAGIYAEQGLWYDLVDALSAAITRAPEDSARANLMEQVDLASVRDYDRQYSGSGSD